MSLIPATAVHSRVLRQTSATTLRCLGCVLLLLVGARSAGAERPNFILFIADDVSWNDYGCYGNPRARTPNIDSLAANGLRFSAAYLTASSCSPSRASLITGRYPHNNGKAAELHLPIAAHLPWFPQLLREHGYYTALSGKNHMQADEPADGQAPRPAAFGRIDGGRTKQNSGGHANWVQTLRQRPPDQPFLMWFASYDAHRGWDADKQWDEARYGPSHRPEDVRVPTFLVDDAETRRDLASYYNEVTRFDYYIGQVVEELRRQQQLDNTLIFVLADNGRPFPRAKTRLHDSGMQTALVAHWPAGIQSQDSGAASVCSNLVSAIDIAPTVLAAADITAPPTFQGVSLLPIFQDPAATVRKYAFSEHNWHDYEAHGRSVRDGQFLYVQNHRPELPWQGPADSVRSPSHMALQTQLRANQLTPAQQDVFMAPRPAEELYLVGRDPDQLDNLADDPNYAQDLKRLRGVLVQWTDDTADSTPPRISADGFDRDSGQRLKNVDYRATTPGEDRNAAHVNTPGPR